MNDRTDKLNTQNAEVESDPVLSPQSSVLVRLKPLLPLWHAVRDWWRDLLVMTLASLAWVALSLTVIGGPPAGAALFAMARACALHEAPDTALFLASLRAYFVRSWLLGLVGAVGIAVWVADLIFYSSLLARAGEIGIVGGAVIAYLGVIWLQTLLYAWALLISRDDLRTGQLIRNGAIMALRFSTQTLINTLFVAGLLGLSFYLPFIAVLALPPIVALLGIHSLYAVAPELVPDDSEALAVVS
jgi:uncharacterized membrane protein YesL